MLSSSLQKLPSENLKIHVFSRYTLFTSFVYKFWEEVSKIACKLCIYYGVLCKWIAHCKQIIKMTAETKLWNLWWYGRRHKAKNRTILFIIDSRDNYCYPHPSSFIWHMLTWRWSLRASDSLFIQIYIFDSAHWLL